VNSFGSGWGTIGGLFLRCSNGASGSFKGGEFMD
jgi:hypothetical protein